MGPALAKAFAGFKVVAIRADQVGFAVFLAFGVCWGWCFRSGKYAIKQDPSKRPLPCENSNQNPKCSCQNRQFVQKVKRWLCPNHCRDSEQCVTLVGILKHSQAKNNNSHQRDIPYMFHGYLSF